MLIVRIKQYYQCARPRTFIVRGFSYIKILGPHLVRGFFFAQLFLWESVDAQLPHFCLMFSARLLCIPGTVKMENAHKKIACISQTDYSSYSQINPIFPRYLYVLAYSAGPCPPPRSSTITVAKNAKIKGNHDVNLYQECTG